MKYRLDDDSKTDKNAAQVYIDETSALYGKINKMLELNPADPILVSIYKLFMRLIFVLFCIALSPFVLVGLFLAVIVVA
ncbi:MAG: hypothetical protein AB8G22_00300 [Saprospiraceae bacterium]